MGTDQTPKRKRAVALRYEDGQDQPPVVVASGQGLVAEKILEQAAEHGVPVRENAELALALSEVELGSAIPEALFPVVAEVLVFVSRMNRVRGNAGGASQGRPG